jgi:hypothetical protein
MRVNVLINKKIQLINDCFTRKDQPAAGWCRAWADPPANCPRRPQC